MAYHRSRSLGVGAKIIRRRKSLTSICHCSKDRSISLTLIIYLPNTQLLHSLAQFLHKFIPFFCVFHLGFGLGLGELSEGAQFSGGVGRVGVGGVVHVHEVAHDLVDGTAGDVLVVRGNDGIAGSSLVDGVDAVQLAGPGAGAAI